MMLTLWMLQVLCLVSLHKGMLECLLSGLLCGNNSKVLKEFLLEIFTLNLLEIEVSFQAMIQLLLVREQLVCDLNDWIVVSKTVRIQICAELVWDIALQVVLNIEYKLSLKK